ncbi:prepilin peptidase [bacterium]|nr:prepilin peptidase [bacterium]
MIISLESLLTIASIFFGASWGSFLNVVISRVPEGLSVVSPPSRCPKCGNGIKFYDNIPVLSWIILRGKCRHCKTSISIQYPIIELLGALMGLALYKEFDLSFEYFYYFVFVFGGIALAYIDLKTWLVPISIVVIMASIGLIIPLIFFIVDIPFYITLKESLLGLALGAGIISFIILFYKYVRKMDALGWGDAYVLGMIGLYIGNKGVLVSLFLATLQASIIGIGMILINKKSTVPYDDVNENDPIKNKAALPFVPFLVIAGFEYLFFGEKLINWYLNFMKSIT